MRPSTPLTRTRTRTRTGTRTAAVLATAAVVAAAAAPAGAATPDSSTLVAPKKSGQVVSAWDGAFDYPGLDAAFLVGATDEHTLTIKVPGKKPAKYFKTRVATVHIALTWEGGSTNDMDLYVFDADGNEVASSAEAATEGESVTIPVTGPVVYTVEVDNWLSAPGTAYSATATLTVTQDPLACATKGRKGKKGKKKGKGKGC